MAGIALKNGTLTTKGVPLKRKIAGAAIGLGVLLTSVIGGTNPNPGGGGGGTPIAGGLGLFKYSPPANVTGSSCYVRNKATKLNVRTLWNNRQENGIPDRLAHWDGRLYDLKTAPAGEYEIVIDYYNIQDFYEGGIGNTSLNLANMDDMWRGYDFVHDGLQVGTRLYFTPSYVEGGSWLLSVDVSNPQVVEHVFGHNGYMSGCTMRRLAYDGTRIYCAFYDTIGTKNSGIIAVTETTKQPVAFSGGTNFKPMFAPRTESVIGLQTEVGTNLDNLIADIAVQTTGNLLVATYPSLNQVRTFNKLTGALLKTLTYTTPTGCVFDAQDRLVLTTGTNTTAYYTVNADGTINAAVTTFAAGAAKPFDLKKYGNQILMTDHGYEAQQVRAYNADGSLAWVFGQPGGQNATARVAIDRFLFATPNNAANWSAVVPLDNGKFWVIEPWNNRMQLFNADRTPVGGALGVVSYRTSGYTFALNQNDTTDITWKYQRFKVTYSDDVRNDWTFTHNYLPFAPAGHFTYAGNHGDQQGLELGGIFKSIYTDQMNGRTYAYCIRPDNQYQEFEVTDTGLRTVGGLTSTPYSFDKDGNRVLSRFTGANNVNYGWEVQPRTGFDANGNRILGTLQRPTTILGVNPDLEPYDASGYPNADAYLKTEGGYRPLYLPNLVQYIGKVRQDGWRLGLVKEGNSKWDMLLNKTTGGISYYGGQPLDGYYTNGDHATYVMRDNAGNAILDANGEEILLSVGYGGSVVRVNGRLILENVRGEFYHDGQQCQFFLWSEWGTMLYAFGTNSDEQRAYTIATGKRVFPGMSGNAMSTELVRPSGNTNVMYVWYSEEAGSGTLNRRKLVGLDSIASNVITTFSVASGATFASPLPVGSVNLLAKMPAKGAMWRPAKTLYQNPGCGWTQSRPDDTTNKYGGGNFWLGDIGIKTYDIFSPNGFVLRYRRRWAGSADSMTWISDAFVNPSEAIGYQLRLAEHYEETFANNDEIGNANSGGMYRHIKDAAGKILIRSYIKATSNTTVAVIVNGKTIVNAPATETTDLWRKLRTYQDWTITVTRAGAVTVKWSTFPPVTITTSFEAGGNFNSDSFRVEYLAWDNNQSRDRVVALKSALFVPTYS